MYLCRYSDAGSIFLVYLAHANVWPLGLLALFILIIGFVYCKCKTDARNIARVVYACVV